MKETLIMLSIILPTYKERKNLEVFIPQIEEEFRDVPSEIIVVDDGSKDGTTELLAALNSKFKNIRFIERPGLMGIGSALRDGYNAAEGEYILSSDADLSFSVPDMRALYKKIKEGYDFVLGYKIESSAPQATEMQHVSFQLYLKHIVSKLGNWLIRRVSGIKNLKNFNTNFRIIRRSKWNELKVIEDRNFFLCEMILKANQRGFTMTEIPVSFHNRKFGSSKMILSKEMRRSLIKLLQYTIFRSFLKN